ncbi:MAG: hypothetical protein A2020_02955 [Lentisphaerae bacterium GWF2_45_14]|nr:MAG: hypothetical protein A2020_02955 [Lentisphaerae bacterium GWF2_45_14]
MGKKEDDITYVDGCPEWMLTMGDTMSLLVTFFVLLLSFSSKDDSKLLDALEGIRGALSINPVMSSPSPGLNLFDDATSSLGGDVKDGTSKEIKVSKDSVAVVNLRTVRIKNRFNEFREKIMELGFKSYISVKQLDGGIYVDIPCGLIFPAGSAQLDFKAPRILEGFANLANSVGNELQITLCFKPEDSGEGVRSSWALADRRIQAVADMLNGKYNVNRRRFGYGHKVLSAGEPYVRLMLAEKIGISEVTDITEFINQGQNP